ncbi:MAG: DNA primase [Desulfobacterales bacterium]
MAYRIPEDKIAEIKNACDIVEIVSESVVLKRTGRNFVGLCPFHAEKTPSFTVSSDKQIFHCFGCGEGGNVFSFLMKQNGVGFLDAVKLLAARCGIELPRPQLTDAERRQVSLRDRLLSANRSALAFFRRNLLDAPSGRRALAYLEHRGLDKTVIDRFQLGYAPGGWDLLTRHLIGRGVGPDQLEAAGLSVRRKQGTGFYDRFRDRIVFPITDPTGNVIGFGGRVMGEGMPKYLNSPETPLYNKRKTLYAIREAREACRGARSVYIVEGYFDAIALHARGIENAVATLGTALTSEQVRLVKGFIGRSGTAVLVYDSDTAGIKAAQRSIDIFNREFVDARILVLPEGHDPDSFLRDFGPKAFLEKAEGARGMTTFLVDTAIGRHGLSPEGKIRVLSEVAPALAAVQDPIDRGVIVRSVAEQLQVDESAVVAKIGRCRIDGAPADPGGTRRPKAEVRSTGPAPMDRTELKLVAMMLQFPEMLETIREKGVVDCLASTELKEIGVEVLARSEQGGDGVSEMLSSCPDPAKKRLITTLAMAEEAWTREGSLKLIHHFVENIQHRRKLEDLDRRIHLAEESGDDGGMLQLLAERQQLAVNLDRLKRELQER